ncbi:MAG: hypothetical protein GWN01_09235 [Nitrosopumilaceae archaeon]|nr:hypothetical protein [Nitrosopumilaceae archaeon]NIU87792.1 hypothetical protein [Nitrosopumilaceae archaeon]NIV65175.1 hypothetical protein [Nitrosopumilaceae archaeon]NIX61690.1 hypothetical protein [Nitrosopumilaceae archaeon]
MTTLVTVKTALGITTSLSDDRLNQLIEAASFTIEEAVDRVFARELVTEKLGVDSTILGRGGDVRLMLSRIPIQHIQGVRFNGDSIDLSTIQVEDSEAGFLFRREGFGETQIHQQKIERVRSGRLDPLWGVDYTAGYILPSFSTISLTIAPGDINVSDDLITNAGHGLLNGDPVQVSTTGTLPSPLISSRNYFVRDSTKNTFKIADTIGSSAVDLSDTGTGTHTINRPVTLPRSLEQLTIEFITFLWKQEGRDPTIERESLGDWGASYSMGSFGIPNSIATRLMTWRRF